MFVYICGEEAIANKLLQTVSRTSIPALQTAEKNSASGKMSYLILCNYDFGNN